MRMRLRAVRTRHHRPRAATDPAGGTRPSVPGPRPALPDGGRRGGPGHHGRLLPASGTRARCAARSNARPAEGGLRPRAQRADQPAPLARSAAVGGRYRSRAPGPRCRDRAAGGGSRRPAGAGQRRRAGTRAEPHPRRSCRSPTHPAAVAPRARRAPPPEPSPPEPGSDRRPSSLPAPAALRTHSPEAQAEPSRAKRRSPIASRAPGAGRQPPARGTGCPAGLGRSPATRGSELAPRQRRSLATGASARASRWCRRGPAGRGCCATSSSAACSPW